MFLIGCSHPEWLDELKGGKWLADVGWEEKMAGQAAAIASGDHWTWAAAPGWVNSKPVGKFAALRNHPGGSDQLFAGLIVESGGTATPEQIVAGIESAVQSSGQDFTPISAEPDQIAGRTWTQFKFTMTYQNLPLHYIYRAYASPDGCYTLVGWSLQSDFASGKYLILQAWIRW